MTVLFLFYVEIDDTKVQRMKRLHQRTGLGKKPQLDQRKKLNWINLLS